MIKYKTDTSASLLTLRRELVIDGKNSDIIKNLDLKKLKENLSVYINEVKKMIETNG